jgi:hypothetical protein
VSQATLARNGSLGGDRVADFCRSFQKETEAVIEETKARYASAFEAISVLWKDVFISRALRHRRPKKVRAGWINPLKYHHKLHFLLRIVRN